MQFDLIVLALVLACLSGFPSVFMPRFARLGQRSAAVLMVLASALGLAGAVWGLFLHSPVPRPFPWPAEGDSMIGPDALSCFFLVPVFLMGGLGSVYGLGYWSPVRHRRNVARLQVFWGLLVGGLALLVIAVHALAFLLGWELMALSAFFLVSLEDEKPDCRQAGLIYLIATHVGTLALFILFVLWRHATGSYAFEPASAGSIGGGARTVFFLFALLAFGLKAGMMPLHFWLPGAHANAPSHVSAILSGVVLKMGIYGLVRFLFLFPSPPPLWGGFILLLGATSGLLGVAFALGQHDLKRLLAYHSVENIGIILMGLGLALLGKAAGRTEWLVLGLAGCLLHVWNHALFKPLLFFGAGSVLRSGGTRRIDLLGGLGKRMPWTSGLFLAGAVAICGLPPLNGFVSELFLYLGLFGSLSIAGSGMSAPVLVVPVLAMIGALALACFVKVFGIAFLGNPRTPEAERAHEAPVSMLLPMAVLALACLVIGAAPFAVAPVLDAVLAETGAFAGVGAASLSAGPDGLTGLADLVPFGPVSLLSLIILLVSPVLWLIFSRMRKPGPVAGTWDCGYAGPTNRMQYTAASFARSIVTMFAPVLKVREHRPHVSGPFPSPVSMSSHIDDATLDTVILPAASRIERVFAWFRRFQQGLTQHYVFYILITVALLLATLIPFDRILAVFTAQ